MFFRKDFKRVTHEEWLNDEIINFYIHLILRRNYNLSKFIKKKKIYPNVYIFNTYFM